MRQAGNLAGQVLCLESRSGHGPLRGKFYKGQAGNLRGQVLWLAPVERLIVGAARGYRDDSCPAYGHGGRQPDS